MDKELFSLVQEAKTWLASQPPPQPLSLEWHTHNQFRSFIDMLEKDSSLQSLELAIQALRRHMVKNFHWSAECCTAVSRFCARADHIRRQMKGTATKQEVVR
jgi:uncharacterized protein Yka (UPF0111/DUF47 family)